jgi:hypothetical protein
MRRNFPAEASCIGSIGRFSQNFELLGEPIRPCLQRRPCTLPGRLALAWISAG